MVRDHYAKLGFTVTSQAEDGASTATLPLDSFEPSPSFIHVSEGPIA